MTLFSGFMFSDIITSRITFLLCSNVNHSFLDDRVENNVARFLNVVLMVF